MPDQRRIGLTLAPLALIAPALVILGWVSGQPVLTTLGGGETVKLNTAIGLLAAGASSVLMLVGRTGRVSLASAGLCLALAAATLVQHLFGVDLRIDDPFGLGQDGAPPGRMSPVMSFGLLLVGGGLALAHLPGRRSPAAGALLAGVLLAGLSVFDHLYGTRVLVALPSYSTVSLPAAVTLLAVSFAGAFPLAPEAALGWNRDRGLKALVLGAVTAVGGGALLARATGAALIPPALGFFLCVIVSAGALAVAFRETLRARRERVQELERLNHSLVRTTHDLADREMRLRVALEAARMGDWCWDARTDRLTLSPRAAAILGVPPGQPTAWRELEPRLHSEDRVEARRVLATALRRRKIYEVEYRLQRGDETGEARVLVAGRGLYEAGGRVAGTIGVVSDVTQLRREQESERLLAREVDHRAKNVLAVVQAVVRLTPFVSRERYVKAVSARIDALARAHSLLAKNRWTGGRLEDVLRQEIAPYADAERVALAGPPVELEASAVQPVAALIHELVANAVEHGALAGPNGTIEVSWRAEGPERLVLCWDERADHTIEPPARHGFGSAVVAGSVRQLGGDAQWDWRPQGLLLTLTLPAARFLSGAALPTPQAPASQARRARTGLDNARVLVVEDEPLLALELRDTLEAAGCAVLGPALSLGQALTLLEHQTPDAAVLDVNLGGDTSAPIAAALARRGVPFLFLTGYERPDVIPARVLQKPVAPEDLLDALAEELAPRPAAAE